MLAEKIPRYQNTDYRSDKNVCVPFNVDIGVGGVIVPRAEERKINTQLPDFETVYSQAAGADYWRIVNSYQGEFSYNTLKEEDARYVDFKAYKEKGVIYCNMREKPFYESMPTEPEVVLADLIQIFHPQLLSGHQPGYYELLK